MIVISFSKNIIAFFIIETFLSTCVLFINFTQLYLRYIVDFYKKIFHTAADTQSILLSPETSCPINWWQRLD